MPQAAAASNPSSDFSHGSRLSRTPMIAPPMVRNRSRAIACAPSAADSERCRARIHSVAAAAGGVSRTQGHQLASWPTTNR